VTVAVDLRSRKDELQWTISSGGCQCFKLPFIALVSLVGSRKNI